MKTTKYRLSRKKQIVSLKIREFSLKKGSSFIVFNLNLFSDYLLLIFFAVLCMSNAHFRTDYTQFS